MAVRLDRSYTEDALNADPKFSTPHFITLLIERGYIKKDGNLPVLREPIVIADIINGKLRYRLPVVYITRTYYDEDPVNVKFLASRLKGVAHVLVQKSNMTNSRIKEATKLIDTLDEEERRIRKKALDDARAEADALLDGFDEEMKKLQNQVEELTRVNEVLQFENQGLKAKIDSSNAVPVLFMGDEFEFYQGEIKDLLLAVLTEALKATAQKSRRADIIRDIIRNNDYQKLSMTKAEELKKLLKSYDGMSGRTRQALKDLGFEITEEGKHYKITYYGDGRYQTTYSKTPSDGRTGKNSAQQTINMVF